MSQTGQNAPPLTRRSNLLATLSDSFAETDHEQQVQAMQQGLERKLNYQSACTVKALSPILQIIAHEQTLGMADEAAADLSRQIVGECRRQAFEVSTAMNLSDNSMTWGNSYYASAIAPGH